MHHTRRTPPPIDCEQCVAKGQIACRRGLPIALLSGQLGWRGCVEVLVGASARAARSGAAALHSSYTGRRRRMGGRRTGVTTTKTPPRADTRECFNPVAASNIDG